MNQQLEVQKQVYKKTFLHSCKYLNDDVIGVLTGTSDAIGDAFPLFHSRVVQGTLELALDLIQSTGVSIIGVYESRVRSTQGPSEVAQEVLNQIPNGVYMRIVEILNDDEIGSSLVAKVDYIYEQMKFTVAGKQVRVQDLDYDVIEDALVQRLHLSVIDMDAHFENVSMDFTNKYLND